MASWVITISNDYRQHWDYAREHWLWDMPKNFPVRAGDHVYFRFAGGGLIGQTISTSDARPLVAADAVPWDDGRDPYTTRFTFRLLSDQPLRSDAWGVTASRLTKSPVMQVPRSWTAPEDQAVLASYFEPALMTASAMEGQMKALLVDAGIDPVELDVESMTQDQRDVVAMFVHLREGQQKFRADVISAYGACAVTRTTVPRALDAAHISDYKGKHTQVVANGILLRSDLHRLFDAKLLTVTAEDYLLRVSPDLDGTAYDAFDRQPIHVPSAPADQPNRDLLRAHNDACRGWLSA